MHARHVGSISCLLLIAAAGILGFSQNGRADGPPPLPPPPPGVAGTSGTGQMPAILVHAGTDTISVEASVERNGLGASGVIRGPRSALRYALASGGTLELDGDTPEGVYDLADGGQVTLVTPKGYPRHYTYMPKLQPVFAFSVSSRRRIGALVASEETRAFTEASDAALAEFFRSKAQYRSWRVRNDEPLAFAVPLDWYRRTWIELPDSLRNYRVLFFGYGESADAPPTRPILRYGAVRFTVTPRPAREPVALPGTDRLDLVGEVRLVLNGPTTVRVEKVR